MEIKKVPVVSDEWVIEIGDKIIPLLVLKNGLLLVLVIVACFLTYNIGWMTSQDYLKMANILGAGTCDQNSGICTKYWLVQDGTQVKWQSKNYTYATNGTLNNSIIPSGGYPIGAIK